MITNTVSNYIPERKPKRKELGLSLITEREVELLEEIDPNQETLSAILTVKAVFNGQICGIE